VNLKTKTSLAILGTLLIGMILGALLYSIVVHLRMNRLHSMLGPDMFSERLLDAAGPLNDAEYKAAKNIIGETGMRIHATIDSSRIRMDAVVDSMVVRLDSVLSDQQMARLRREIGTIRSGPPSGRGLPPRPGGPLFGHGSPQPPGRDGQPPRPGGPPPDRPPPNPPQPNE
jgi:hypothetical protein